MDMICDRLRSNARPRSSTCATSPESRPRESGHSWRKSAALDWVTTFPHLFADDDVQSLPVRAADFQISLLRRTISLIANKVSLLFD